MLRPGATRRFRPESLFRPRSVLLVGAETALGQRFAANLARFPGVVTHTAAACIDAHPAADLAVLACAPDEVPGALLALGRVGTFAVVCAVPATGLVAAAEAAGVRVMGPASFGIVVPALGLDASAGPLPAAPGKVALVSQSAALCRAVLDWAGPNGVGFSYVVGVGGGAQMGFAAALDWLSRDGGTGAILLDVRTIRDRRAFIAAARAAARLRPVVAIRAGGRLADPTGRGDAVFDAALRRAGVLRVRGLVELLEAAEILTRVRPPRTEALVIVSNAIGLAHLAADAAVAAGVPLLEIDAVAAAVLRLRLPPGPTDRGVVWTGAEEPTRLADAAAMLSGVPATGGVVVILSPTGHEDGAAVAALVAARNSLRVPLLVSVLGETTGAGHRRTLAEAGVPVFETPEEAVGAFALMVQQRRARALAVELPPRRVLEGLAGQDQAAEVLAGAAGALTDEQTGAVLSAYRLQPGHEPGLLALRVTVHDDALFGPAIAVGLGGAAGPLGGDMTYELPPLNFVLAQALVGRIRVGTMSGSTADALADALVRISQMVIDHPCIGDVVIDPLSVGHAGVGWGAARITLRPPGARARFAITPYPAELSERFDARGTPVLIRPIRPEDAEAHVALFRRLTPEDIRFRFFNLLRELPAEQTVRMTQVDYDREMAFVAVEPGGDTVGVARLVREPGTDDGEFAVVVEPAMKGRGLARRLMERLLEWGQTKDMRTITGQVLTENAPMLAFMRRMGAELRRLPDEGGVVEAVIPVPPVPS